MKTCLAVDDSSFDLKMLELCARKTGFDVVAASSGKAALALCAKSFPDLILLDWEMAEMTGIEFMAELRKLEGAAAVPVILCTSHEHPSFIGHAYVKGAAGYIVKPITQEKLQEKLEALDFQK